MNARLKVASVFVVIGLIITGCSPVITASPIQTPPPTVTSTPVPTETPIPTPVPKPPPGRIAFSSNRDGNWNIYTANTDGSGLTRLTSAPGNYFSPDWSPDGSQIAFVFADTQGNNALSIMSAGGGPGKPILSNIGFMQSLSWSPDGKWIAFATNHYYTEGDVWLVHPDGTGLTQLYRDYVGTTSPTWSPDSQTLAVTWGGCNVKSVPPVCSFGIYQMDPYGGTKPKQLLYSGQDISQPAWSPDGKRMAFYDNDAREIFVANIDGTGLTQVTRNMDAAFPSWSPDGEWLVFQSKSEGNEEIYAIRTDGSGLTNISRNPADDTDPKWSLSIPTQQQETTAITNPETAEEVAHLLRPNSQICEAVLTDLGGQLDEPLVAFIEIASDSKIGFFTAIKDMALGWVLERNKSPEMGMSTDCSRQTLELTDVNSDQYPEIVAIGSEYRNGASGVHSREWLLVAGAKGKEATHFLLYEDSQKTASRPDRNTKWTNSDYTRDGKPGFVAWEFLDMAWAIRCIRWGGNGFVEDKPFGLLPLCHKTSNPVPVQPPTYAMEPMTPEQQAVRRLLAAIQLNAGDYSFFCWSNVDPCTPQSMRKTGSVYDQAMTLWEKGVRVVNLDRFMFYVYQDGMAWSVENVGEIPFSSELERVILTTDASASTYIPVSGEWITCPGEPASKLHVSMQASFLSRQTQTVTLYAGPFNLAGTSEIGQGQYVDIIGGPACPAEGGTWWKIKLTASGKEGWTREAGFDEWLMPQ